MSESLPPKTRPHEAVSSESLPSNSLESESLPPKSLESKPLPKLEKGAHIHFMGVCGTAMASLAGLMKEMGYKITGSDQNIYPPMSLLLERLQIPVKLGYKKENLEPKPDFVVVGNVISKKYEEAQALLSSDIPYTSLPKAMGEWLIADRKSIVIAGTHGKTTTTSLMAWITDHLGLQPGFMVGGIPKNFGQSFKVPKGDLFVIEGDEYDTAFFDKVPKFIHYKPYYTILGSIEFDHADIYKNLDDVLKAFSLLAEKSHPDGVFVYHAENENTVRIAQQARSRNCVSFGISKGDYQAANITYSPEAMEYDLMFKDTRLCHIQTQTFGEYNILNSIACLALAHQVGWDLSRVVEAIATFEGVKRRQEILGNVGGITVIEDFAHHPTAVRMTIDAVKKRYQKARIHAVFEPRSATSRRKIFQKDYVEAFELADCVWISRPFGQENIPAEDRFSTEDLIRDIGPKANSFEVVDDGVKSITASAQENDVIVIMSNGGFDGIYQKLMSALALK